MARPGLYRLSTELRFQIFEHCFDIEYDDPEERSWEQWDDPFAPHVRTWSHAPRGLQLFLVSRLIFNEASTLFYKQYFPAYKFVTSSLPRLREYTSRVPEFYRHLPNATFVKPVESIIGPSGQRLSERIEIWAPPGASWARYVCPDGYTRMRLYCRGFRITKEYSPEHRGVWLVEGKLGTLPWKKGEEAQIDCDRLPVQEFHYKISLHRTTGAGYVVATTPVHRNSIPGRLANEPSPVSDTSGPDPPTTAMLSSGPKFTPLKAVSLNTVTEEGQKEITDGKTKDTTTSRTSSSSLRPNPSTSGVEDEVSVSELRKRFEASKEGPGLTQKKQINRPAREFSAASDLTLESATAMFEKAKRGQLERGRGNQPRLSSRESIPEETVHDTRIKNAANRSHLDANPEPLNEGLNTVNSIQPEQIDDMFGGIKLQLAGLSPLARPLAVEKIKQHMMMLGYRPLTQQSLTTDQPKRGESSRQSSFASIMDDPQIPEGLLTRGQPMKAETSHNESKEKLASQGSLAEISRRIDPRPMSRQPSSSELKADLEHPPAQDQRRKSESSRQSSAPFMMENPDIPPYLPPSGQPWRDESSRRSSAPFMMKNPDIPEYAPPSGQPWRGESSRQSSAPSMMHNPHFPEQPFAQDQPWRGGSYRPSLPLSVTMENSDTPDYTRPFGQPWMGGPYRPSLPLSVTMENPDIPDYTRPFGQTWMGGSYRPSLPLSMTMENSDIPDYIRPFGQPWRGESNPQSSALAMTVENPDIPDYIRPFGLPLRGESSRQSPAPSMMEDPYLREYPLARDQPWRDESSRQPSGPVPMNPWQLLDGGFPVVPAPLLEQTSMGDQPRKGEPRSQTSSTGRSPSNDLQRLIERVMLWEDSPTSNQSRKAEPSPPSPDSGRSDSIPSRAPMATLSRVFDDEYIVSQERDLKEAEAASDETATKEPIPHTRFPCSVSLPPSPAKPTDTGSLPPIRNSPPMRTSTGSSSRPSQTLFAILSRFRPSTPTSKSANRPQSGDTEKTPEQTREQILRQAFEEVLVENQKRCPARIRTDREEQLIRQAFERALQKELKQRPEPAPAPAPAPAPEPAPEPAPDSAIKLAPKPSPLPKSEQPNPSPPPSPRPSPPFSPPQGPCPTTSLPPIPGDTTPLKKPAQATAETALAWWDAPPPAPSPTKSASKSPSKTTSKSATKSPTKRRAGHERTGSAASASSRTPRRRAGTGASAGGVSAVACLLQSRGSEDYADERDVWGDWDVGGGGGGGGGGSGYGKGAPGAWPGDGFGDGGGGFRDV